MFQSSANSNPPTLLNRGELKIGDVITELDGVPVGKLVETWKPYYAASNEAGRMRNIGRFMTRGECGESDIAVRRENLQVHYTVKRVPAGTSDPGLPNTRLARADVSAAFERHCLSQALLREGG